jgi:WS/DGAT/MGAT family acyltransferase
MGALKEFGRTLKQFVGPLTPMPFNQRFSGHRVLAVAEASFAEARQLRTISGGTINDVVLTVLTGAVRKYLAARADLKSAPELRILCPVNIRQPDRDGIHGNAITFLPMQVPLGDMLPTDRLRRIAEITRALKDARVAEAAAMLLGLVQTLPPLALHTLLTRLAKPGLQDLLGQLGAMPPANILCTNVPGPQIPLYTCGQRLERYYPLAPITMEIGLSCAVTSYDQRLFFTLIGDRHCIPDLDTFHACFLESYDELRHAAAVTAQDYVPLHRVPNGAVKKTSAPQRTTTLRKHRRTRKNRVP